MTYLTPHFTLEEFIQSDTARRKGINNDLPIELRGSAIKVCDMLEALRARLSAALGKDCPIRINSGYRCPELNRAIGSSDTSDHPKAMAADIVAPAYGTPLDLAKFIARRVDDLGVYQLIYEYDWVHVSINPAIKQVNRILTLQGKGYEVGIKEN